MGQSEADSSNYYIICSKCKMKCISDDEHFKTDFGDDRLNIRYKSCAHVENIMKIPIKKTLMPLQRNIIELDTSNTTRFDGE